MADIDTHTIDDEEIIISTIVNHCGLMGKMYNFLLSTDFLSSKNAALYDAICKMYKKEIPIDCYSFYIYLRDNNLLEKCGGKNNILRMMEIKNCVPQSAIQRAKKIKSDAAVRGVIDAARNIAISGANRTFKSAQQYVSDSQAQIGAYSIDDGNRFSLAMGMEPSVAKLLTKLGSGKTGATGIRSGYDVLDRYTNGFQAGDFIVLAARPSMGKTALAANVVINTLRIDRRPVLFFSLEMPRDKIESRMIASACTVNLMRLLACDVPGNKWHDIHGFSNWLMKQPLHIDDKSAITTLYMRSVISDFVKKYGDLGLVVIDYIQIMKPIEKNKNREREISDISMGIKEMAKEYEVPILALSQLSRNLMARDKRERVPVMSDLRGSGSLEQDADVIIFVNRQEVYEPERHDIRGIATISIAKQRNGPIGNMSLRFCREFTRFENIKNEY